MKIHVSDTVKTWTIYLVLTLIYGDWLYFIMSHRIAT